MAFEWKLGGQGGVDIGMRDDGTYKGQVKEGKRHGWGTMLYNDGDRVFGEFCDDEHKRYVERVSKVYIYVKPRMHRPREFFYEPYQPRNGEHRAVIQKAKEMEVKAKLAVQQPWSRRTNHHNVFKRFQPAIMSILLCAERLRKNCRAGIPQALPAEMWEIILLHFVELELHCK
eukprot:m.341772 g.341772  ORF g.341772 m.341772 type:complete len:173 (+) comp20491_c0_seq1:348-866(+)